MKKLVVLFVLLLSIVIVSSACSSSANTGEQEEKEPVATEETPQEEPEEQPEEEVEATERVVEHMKGETAVPATPERVIVISHVSWEGSLLSVGVKPIAAMTFDDEFAPHLADQLEGVEPIPFDNEVNLEKLLELEPDLLIVSDRFDQVYDELTKIAPTIMIEVGGDWKEDHLKTTEAVGKLEEGQKVIEELDEKAAEASEKLQEALGEKTVMALSINKEDIRVFGRTDHAMNNLLYDDLKLNPYDGIPEGFGENISLEGLTVFDPDYMLDISYFRDTDYFSSVMDSEVWNNLTAVKNDNVYTLDNNWGFWDPIERANGMDEIVELFVK
ncbi:ABC transporter substrate-binding protein [Alkalihalobacillus sp. LMS39]|uniref:ABC transporter substrate-binding protein n=1 Tax=Alkalihalobacillus sp. LMS39 TaxID=2924032 RepID=UPI001FB4E86E|nr:ABC transporter substrate-binding protein [Alkalihalobacillus sp. LMS39]UOE93588.1 ABC transporter substrate-binding protein [Alkalihalobacillus sp. LMS39]